MKKIISLLLAAMLCLCALTPVLAESLGDSLAAQFGTAASEPFPYTLDSFKMYFDLLSDAVLGVKPVWSATGEGENQNIALEGFGNVIVVIENGSIIRYEMAVTVTVDNANELGYGLGSLLGLVFMSSKAAEDVSYLSDSAATDAFSTQLNNLLQELLGKINEAIAAPVSVTGEVMEDTATFTLSVDLTNMTLTLDVKYEP